MKVPRDEWRKLGIIFLLGLLGMTSVTAGQQPNDPSIGPQNGLMATVARKGANIRFQRQLPPPTTPSPTTMRTNPPTPTPSSSSSSLSNTTISTTTTSTTSTPPTTPTPLVTATVNFSLAEVREVDPNGNKVKQNDGSFRAFNAFDNQDFNVTSLPTDYVIPNSRVPSDALDADAILPAPYGELDIQACVTKANGVVALGDGVMTLTKGQLKVSVEVEHWQWCGNACAAGSQQTKYLEVDFAIQVPAGGKVVVTSQNQSDGYPKRFSLGKDAWADFSTKVLVDGVWRNITTGYPKLSNNNNVYIITVRFERFNTSVTYDINFDPGYTALGSSDMGGVVGCANRLRHFHVLLFTCLILIVKITV